MLRCAARARGRLGALVGAALALAAGAAPSGAADELAVDERPAVAGELIVKLRPGVRRERGSALAREQGGDVVEELGARRLHRVRLPEGKRRAARRALARHPEIEWAAPNELLPPSALPDDPYYTAAWHLPKISAPGAWELATGDGVTIAVLDSGVDAAHPDLRGKLLPGWNFHDDTPDTSDGYGHGTRVAGVAAAATGNALGVPGVGWNARILPIRVTRADGWASAWAIAQGLTWAVDHGARVMNLSFANVGDNQAIADAAAYVAQRGGVVVAGAGNCACDETTPDRAELITVSATLETDALASFSSRGAHVDLAAPGVRIPSTNAGGGYGSYSGTSYASPVVAGVAALLLSVDPSLDAPGVEALLEATALDLGAPGWDAAYGHGRVDAFRAVELAGRRPPQTADTTPPTAALVAPGAWAELAGTVTVDVAGDDDTGVSAVELRVDGVALTRDVDAPFQFAWDTTSLPDGLHGLEAVAFDAAGNQGVSELRVVHVVNGALDTAPPTAVITSPSGKKRRKVKDELEVRVTAADDLRVETVELLVDGVPIGAQSCGSASCSLAFVWQAGAAAKGAHVLEARAVDGDGKPATSTPVTVKKKSP
jgi:subtilisin family serine protease